MNETIKTILKRTSCRSFKEDQVSEQDVQLILDAGLSAPSGMNRQECIATAVMNKELLEQLIHAVGHIFEEDRGPNYICNYHAPTLIIVSGPVDAYALQQDGSCMMENMFIAATALGLGSCWINQLKDVQDDKYVRGILNQLHIPTDHAVVGCIALGYASQEKEPTPKNKERIQIIK